jgi:hypothetical protein
MMAREKKRDQEKERVWRQWIREWQGSDLTVRAFCEDHALSEASFYAWRRQLAKRDAQATTFVPVQLVAEKVPDSGSGVELVLPGGLTVRLTPGFDTATLRQLLAVLEQRPC